MVSEDTIENCFWKAYVTLEDTENHIENENVSNEKELRLSNFFQKRSIGRSITQQTFTKIIFLNELF